MRIKSLSWVLTCLALAAMGRLSLNGAETEKTGPWKVLFDGKTMNGWHTFKKHTFPDKGWLVEPDGSLHHFDKGGGGDLISDAVFDTFDLEWDWKIAPGGNSGLKYLVSEDRPHALGHEYQLIDDARHEDGRRGAKWQTASFYDVLPPHDMHLKPAGEWNHSRVLIQGSHVEHWLNGSKVLEYELGSAAVLAAVAESKFKKVTDPKFGTKFPGHLLLQDHGDEIWFRNIRIRDLTRTVSMGGEVRDPGIFDFQPGFTLVKAISRTGGPKKGASGTVYVSKANGKQFVFDLGMVMKREESDFSLEPGDVVWVPHAR